MMSREKKDEPENDHLVKDYIKSLSDVERSTMKIAQDHLKTSYSVKKSIGYLKWLSERNIQKKHTK